MPPAHGAFMTLDKEELNEQDKLLIEQENILNGSQERELCVFQKKFVNVIKDAPDIMTLVLHMIPTTNVPPIRLPPYKLVHHS